MLLLNVVEAIQMAQRSRNTKLGKIVLVTSALWFASKNAGRVYFRCETY
jgi:hypothetical protein